VDRNNLPAAAIRRSRLLQRLLADGNRQLIQRDLAGRVHFHPEITNARDVQRILGQLQKVRYAALIRRDGPRVLEIFEHLFDHESFTGRSGTFFGYEGLGCIYWHMVSKLLLAVQETYFRALDERADKACLHELADFYHDIRAGLGDAKSPENYGAFPMDPYSHTPGQGGARQPGLTGQVKEDFLCRFGELGVAVQAGQIHFRPRLLRREEFLTQESEFHYFDIAGVEQRIRLQPGELAFTYCQVPVVYRLDHQNSLTVVRRDRAQQTYPATTLDLESSREVWARTGVIERIQVNLVLPPSDSSTRGAERKQSP
jgi:hypothetical protein